MYSSSAYLTTGVGVLCGVIGYFFREYRNRIRPLFELTSLVENTTKRSDKVNVPVEVINQLADNYSLGDLTTDSNLAYVYDCWDICDDLKLFWPETKKIILNILNCEDSDDKILPALTEALRNKYFSEWLQGLLVSNKLNFLLEDIPSDQKEKISYWIENEENQCVWFDLVPITIQFGTNLNHPAIAAKCDPFIKSVAHIHIKGLKNALKKYQEIYDNDYHKAMACYSDLKEIINENSRWVFRCFFANTSNYPVVIKTGGNITIKDNANKSKYIERCNIYLVNEEDGEISESNAPIVVKGGVGVHFALITNKTQKEMELGSAIRDSFERKKSTGIINIELVRTGLLRTQKCKSSTFSFAEQT